MKKKVFLFMVSLVTFMFLSLDINALGMVKLTCTSSNSNTMVCKINLTVSDLDDTSPLDINYYIDDLDAKVNAYGASGTVCTSSKCTVTDIQNGAIATINVTNNSENEIKPTLKIESIYGTDEKKFTLKGIKKPSNTTTKAKSDNNYLSSITVDGVLLNDFSKNKTKYFIELENDVTTTNVKAEAEDDKAKIKIDGPKTLLVGDNEYTISVTSENNTTRFYKLIVTRKEEKESSNTDIESIKIKGYKLNFDDSSKTFYLKINKDDKKLDITVNLKDKKASYEIKGNENLEDGNVIKIIVTAEDKKTDTYRIIIEKNTNNYMLYIFLGIMLLIIISVIIILIIRRNKKNKKKEPAEDSSKKYSNTKEEFEKDKTIEMPAISDGFVENTLSEQDIPPIDNDEAEETRILSYAEKEELERNKKLDQDVLNTIDNELEKTLLFNYEKKDVD